MLETNTLQYEFEPYRFDPSERILTRNGEAISLTPKATDLLVMLVVHAGQLMDKDELLREIWPDTFVEEANLTQNIFLLRKALGDERADPKYIETVARRGYRFIAPVRAIARVENSFGTEASVAATPHLIVIAVLPFINADGDPEIEYLADGITVNIINNLSRVSRLRVMSRSAAFRYKSKTIDPQQVAKELGANMVLLGKIHSQSAAIVTTVELVNTLTDWQVWGESFDSTSKNLLQIEDAITRQVLRALKLELTGDEEKRVTARYTENAAAYQSYLEGRYHWSRYTQKGIDKAIQHFRRAIDLDPNYALAYSAIVDCYLRLATNYLPPEDGISKSERTIHPDDLSNLNQSDVRVRLRFEWDWKGAERELRRANDLKADYPAAHQWYAAFVTSRQLYEESRFAQGRLSKLKGSQTDRRKAQPSQIPSIELTKSERVQVFCAIGRDQIDIGNYDAACQILSPWWEFGNWPKLDELNQQSCADLLFTTGELASFISTTKQLPRGQRHAQELLNGATAFFQQLGFRRSAAEARIEISLCYYREGLFDIARSTLTRVLDDLSRDDLELRSLGLIRLATIERDAGRLDEALSRLIEATKTVEVSGPWATARWYLELASTYKDLAISDAERIYFDKSMHFYLKALYEFRAVGHHRYVAVVENNIGLLLLSQGSNSEAEEYLLRSQRVFESFTDTFRGAQVNETLARLYIETERYSMAQCVIEQAIRTLQQTDGEAYLVEALTTAGVLAIRRQRYADAQRNFEAASSVAERCGDTERAGFALLMLLEHMGNQLESVEQIEIAEQLKRLLGKTKQKTLRVRVEKCVGKME